MSSQNKKIIVPPKPWDSEMEQGAEAFIEFLKNSDNKKQVMDFIIQYYRETEEQNLSRQKARMQNEVEADLFGSEPHHKAGNIAPMLAPTFNMHESERSFARSINSTKHSLDRTVEDRVEEINRLLANIGGFSSQLKSCFARSTVVFFEQDDPEHTYRERLIFSIHLPRYELKNMWGGTPEAQNKLEDGRTLVQATWDDAVNALARIIESSGLNAKYCKNDRNYGQFTMKQDLRNNSVLPDEYFSIILDYITADKIKETSKAYNRAIKDYDSKLAKLWKKLKKHDNSSESIKYKVLNKEYSDLMQEKNFFVGTVPDPTQVEEGLLLYIDVSTLKDYHIVKDKMQSVMTKFILHLSQIALKEAEFNPDLEYDLWKHGQSSKGAMEFVQDVDDGKLYTVNEKDLTPIEGEAPPATPKTGKKAA